MELRSAVLNRKELLIKLRRDLHRIPELSGSEYKTQAYICDFLACRGIAFRKIMTGVVADFAGKDTAKTIALRADTDALPIVEKTAVPYKSVNGNMHACGHDGHTAMLLTLCDLLSLDKPPVNVRAVFQFGEEGAGGAAAMIQDGALAGVNEIFALHADPSLPAGQFAVRSGAMMAGAVEFNVTFNGKESHCAEPEKGIDALAPLTSFLANAELTAAARENGCLLHVGKITGGAARNVVAGAAAAYCTLRYFDEKARDTVMQRIIKFLDGTDARFRTTHTLLAETDYPPLYNTPAAVARVKKAMPDILDAPQRFTAEDFACYTQRIPGCMTWLGVQSKEFASPLHSDTFGFCEDALLYGVEFFLRLLNG